jgi:salicylate hydroxylase
MQTYNDIFILPQASHPLKILIIGAGIAGLTCAIGLTLGGHNVTIYEQSQALTEVGAGIQMGPNAARILGRLGLLEKIMEKSNVMQKNSVRRWKDDVELGSTHLSANVNVRSFSLIIR